MPPLLQHDVASPAELLAALPPAEQADWIARLSDAEAQALQFTWRGFFARPEQLKPTSDDWDTWALIAGRGFGKTRTGAECVREWVDEGVETIHLVARTAPDYRDVMIKGPAGLLNIFPPHQRPKWEPSKRLVTFHTGATALCFSADEPDQLRGPQCEKAWADELAAWRFQDAWDQLQFGLRLGEHPQCVVTTTPRPIPRIKDLLKDARTVATKGSTARNVANLAPSFLRALKTAYEGTRLWAQEWEGRIMEEVPGALWRRAWFELHREKREMVTPQRLVAVDPSASETGDGAECGIIVGGRGANGHNYILADRSVRGGPEVWAAAVVRAYVDYKCDSIVAEANNGGGMVRSTINAAIGGRGLPIRLVHASRGKRTRAEPVALQYEQGKVHHCGVFPELEDQCATWVPAEGDSPDRLDACVWLVTALGPAGEAGRPDLGGLSRPSPTAAYR